ncbi:MAG: Tm-1-like ATP-binding domain-containing protein [Syntrophales bacterium]|jgi:uncharacterized protein (UPF0261 family)|nr:Tm-1-like ATP-binding domain-containing protein [Syntrophales bacterium]
MGKTVLVLATLDTKAGEVAYIKEQLENKGKTVMVLDMSLRGKGEGVRCDVSRKMLLNAAGTDMDTLAALGRGAAIKLMIPGIVKVVRELYGEGKFQAIMTLGGLDGALLAAGAMRSLPLGVPKFLLTPVAQGKQTFGDFVGTSDMVIMHSVIDIFGVNEVSRKIFNTAVGAMIGMLDMKVSTRLEAKNVVAMTMYGNTTPAAMTAKKLLEAQGYEVVVFHPNGTGGMCMEELIEQGLFNGVFDLTTHEITDWLYDGYHACGPERLDAAARKGIPQVVVPGCVDFILKGPIDDLAPEFKKRKKYNFNPAVSLVSTSHEEMERIAAIMAEKLNCATGAVSVLIPLQGFSMYCHKGEELYDPERDAVFIRAFKKLIKPPVRVVEVDAHINDPLFAERAVEELVKLMKK